MILKARGLRKKFSYPVALELLKGIDLTIERGESVAIMGRSGEGKSTLLHILGTLDNASSGELEIASQNISESCLSELRNRHIGFVFQSFHLLEDYTVLDNVLMPARIGRKKVDKGWGEFLLEKVGLKGRIHHFGKQLSGGEKQRVSIARALCNNPDLLLADEPSGNLDKKSAEGIHRLLLDFSLVEKKSLVVVTHDFELASLCKTHYTLKNGLLEQNLS